MTHCEATRSTCEIIYIYVPSYVPFSVSLSYLYLLLDL